MILLDFLPSTLVGLTGICFGLALFAVDADSPINRGLAAGMVLNGLAVSSGTPLVFYHPGGNIPGFVAVLAMAFWLLPVLGIEWLVRIARATQRSALAPVQRCVRIVQALAALAAVLTLLHPAWLFGDFLFRLAEPGVLSRPGFWMFATPFFVIHIVCMLAAGFLLGAGMPPALRLLPLCIILAVPFFAAGASLPVPYSALSNLLAQIIVMFGAIRYYATRDLPDPALPPNPIPIRPRAPAQREGG